MRISVAGRSTIVPTPVRSIASIFADVIFGFRLREVAVFNTTKVAVTIALVRLTTNDGLGAELVNAPWDESLAPPVCKAYAGHTDDGDVGVTFRQATLGGAPGAGIIWPFADNGIVVQPGIANGVGVICPVGDGQILDFHFDWEEQ